MNVKKEYTDNGYIILRDFFSDEDISSISKNVDKVFNPWMKYHKLQIFEQQMVNMHSLTKQEHFKHNPKERINFFNSITPLKLINIVEELFGDKIYFHNTQLFFNPLNKKRLPYWHRDMQYSPITDSLQKEEQNNMINLHIRIPLVKEKSIEVIPGTHKRWDTKLEKDVRLELNGHKNYEDLPNSQLIDLDIGDILIFNAQMIHKGNYIFNDSRKALDLCVGTFHPIPFSFFDHQILPSNEEMNSIRNTQWFTNAKKYIINKKDK